VNNEGFSDFFCKLYLKSKHLVLFIHGGPISVKVEPRLSDGNHARVLRKSFELRRLERFARAMRMYPDARPDHRVLLRESYRSVRSGKALACPDSDHTSHARLQCSCNALTTIGIKGFVVKVAVSIDDLKRHTEEC
jgi:hypothetical protein